MTQSISDDDISTYLDAVQASGVLGKSARRQRLLEYLIRTEVAGQGDTLKAYAIGLDVFDKPDDFDPSTDSSVRVEMGRLRSALAVFNASSHAQIPLSVDIPVGSYRPVLELALIVETIPETPAPTRKWPVIGGMVALLGVAVMGIYYAFDAPMQVVEPERAVRIALVDFQGDPDIAAAVSSVLRQGLARMQQVTVLSNPTGSRQRPTAEFALRGWVGEENPEGHRIDAELIIPATDRLVWAKSLVVANGPDLDQRIAQSFGNELRVRLLGASKAQLAGRDPQTLSPEQLFVMATWVPGPSMNAVEWELQRVGLMRLALTKDPDFGAAHSVMADKLAYLANVSGPSNTPALRDEAVRHAKRAMELAPLDPDVVFNVAQSQWHAGMIGAAETTMARVLELDPGHDLARFLALVIPYSCQAPPDDVLAAAIAFDLSLSADNPIRWLTLTWTGWLHAHRGEYDLALAAEEQAALIFEIPYTFMRHAMLLNKLGQTDQAASIIRQQQTNWPDISPDHFATVTIPRLCQESPDGLQFIQNYKDLAAEMTGRL
ncbi:hypothetical protein [Yoonia sp. SS1-5]|uniref:Tetratricopeptide repeat protein n=1 Tax=Yoonia rhodophyticola TaxID=3137370 RepID=A0AAN0NLQ4_9RHOB